MTLPLHSCMLDSRIDSNNLSDSPLFGADTQIPLSDESGLLSDSPLFDSDEEQQPDAAVSIAPRGDTHSLRALELASRTPSAESSLAKSDGIEVAPIVGGDTWMFWELESASFRDGSQGRRLNDLLRSVGVHYDEGVASTCVSEDRDWLSMYWELPDEDDVCRQQISPWVLRLEFDPNRLQQAGISVCDMKKTLKPITCGHLQVLCPDHAWGVSPQVLRIRAPQTRNPEVVLRRILLQIADLPLSLWQEQPPASKNARLLTAIASLPNDISATPIISCQSLLLDTFKQEQVALCNVSLPHSQLPTAHATVLEKFSKRAAEALAAEMVVVASSIRQLMSTSAASTHAVLTSREHWMLSLSGEGLGPLRNGDDLSSWTNAMIEGWSQLQADKRHVYEDAARRSREETTRRGELAQLEAYLRDVDEFLHSLPL